MVLIEQIKSEILSYEILKDVIEVEFEDYILEVKIVDMEGLDINKDTLAKVIHEKYI